MNMIGWDIHEKLDISGRKFLLYRGFGGKNRGYPRRIKDIENLIKEMEWHMNQLESMDQEFKPCPGAACPGCEFRDRCEFVTNPQLFDTWNSAGSGDRRRGL
jgi:hypothetical protein